MVFLLLMTVGGGIIVAADTAVTIIQAVLSAVTQGLSGILVSAFEIWVWGLFPFPIGLIANLIEPFWAAVEVGFFILFIYLLLKGKGGASLGGRF
jgi:hypothetical protein